MKEKHDCMGCVYWRKLGWTKTTVSVYACHYALVEHKCRGCEPGKNCTKRAQKARRKKYFNCCGEEEELKAHDY